MQVSFDLDEFIAYLLNGCLLLVALNFLFPVPVQSFITNATIFPGNPSAQAVVNTILFGAVALVAGHISSIVARNVLRHLMWKFVKRPRDIPFDCKGSAFWSQNLRDAISLKTTTIFGDINIRVTKEAAPRLIRSYVISKSPALTDVRNRIVRARSLCANAVLPCIMFALGAAVNGSFGWAAFFVVCAGALVIKQHDLDCREWKEIYLGFLAL